jgi:hypothetical protein
MESKKIEPVLEFFNEFAKELGKRDKKIKSDTIKMAMAHKASEGYLMHKPPLGYWPSATKGVYEIDSWGVLLKFVFADVRNGKMDGKTALNGLIFIHQLVSGRKLKKYQVLNWISNPYYAGLVRYKGLYYPGKHRPLMSVEQQDILINTLAEA